MSKIITLISIVIFVYFIFPRPSKTARIRINNQDFDLEIAKTVLQKSRGLMYRKSLCQHCGMIFEFDQSGNYPFWMKNTLIPLDIIWLNDRGVVVDIKTGQPQDITLLSNQESAKFVIETNPSATGLKIGDTIKL